MMELESSFEERAAIEQELEVRDARGVMVPVVVRLSSVEPPHVDADFDDVPAAVLARLKRLRDFGGEDADPSAV